MWTSPETLIQSDSTRSTTAQPQGNTTPVGVSTTKAGYVLHPTFLLWLSGPRTFPGSLDAAASGRNSVLMVPISTPRCLSPSRPFSEPPSPPNPGVYGAGRSPEKPPPLPSADSVSAEARPGPPPPRLTPACPGPPR